MSNNQNANSSFSTNKSADINEDSNSLIPVSLAKRMADAYKRNSKAPKLANGNVLEQLCVTIADIQHITGLRDNPNNLSSIQLIFGVTEETLNESADDQVFTVMVAGAKLDDNGVARIMQDKIADRCRPCPSFCATWPS